MSETRYRSVVDNSPYGIYRVTYDGRFIAANPAFCAMVGYAEVELFALGMERLYESPAERAGLVAEYDVRPHGKPIEIAWRRKDGTAITVRVWVYAERDASGRITYFDGYAEDVTPLRTAERALRQAERLASVGQLISGVAHELNNPLSAILLFAEDLLSIDRPDDEREALAIIAQQARRSRCIVRDLLTFVRERQVVRAPVDPVSLLEQLGRTLEPQTAELGVALYLDVEAADVVHVDAAAIEQVVTNLVMNAAQAVAGLGRPGTVWVSGRLEPQDAGAAGIMAGTGTGTGTGTGGGGGGGGTFVLEVEDDGPGIEPAVLPRLFEPFFTTKPMGQGTGLGLSVTLGLVQQHGGTLTAANRGGDRPGAAFTVRLPLPARAIPVGVGAGTAGASECARSVAGDVVAA